VHAPLVFDIIDSWKELSIARCIYHTRPPDGRVHTTRPANIVEAEERRRERFQTPKPPADPLTVPREETYPIFPMTLDLRFPGRVS
jgi:uncharacterized protein (DUF2126 family)